MVIATPEEAAGRLNALSSMLDVDLSKRERALEWENEEWAEMWEVHQKVIQAESKYK